MVVVSGIMAYVIKLRPTGSLPILRATYAFPPEFGLLLLEMSCSYSLTPESNETPQNGQKRIFNETARGLPG
jgi:hypothetical protein